MMINNNMIMNNNIMNNNMNNYNNIMNNMNVMNNFNNLGNMNNMNVFNPSNINPMTYQLMLNFMLMMNPNINTNDNNNVNFMMMNFMNANPFVYQLFMNSQQNNFNNNFNNWTNSNVNILRGKSENNKNSIEKGGLLPRPGQNNSNMNNSKDPFFGNPNPRINIVFISGTGIKVTMNAPNNISVHDLFVAFIHRMGLDESVLGKYIYFLINGHKIPTDEQTNIVNYGFNSASTIVVLDTSNLLGGIN